MSNQKATASQRRWPAIPLCRPKPRTMFLSQTYTEEDTFFPSSAQRCISPKRFGWFHRPHPLCRIYSRYFFLSSPDMIFTNEASTADLAFDPTLACWSFSYPALGLSRLTLSVFPAGLTSKPHHAQQNLCLRYVDRFGCDCHRLSATDLRCL